MPLSACQLTVQPMIKLDVLGAFVAHGAKYIPPRDGPLCGLTLAVKDLYDVEGVPTGAGNPTWLATHPVAEASSSVVETLLAAGARYVGKTHTDELAWSLNGENVHYGTPVNPAAPGRIPGGSSSGSAVAVAAGLADFALGTDTGGSVRLPASYCGVYGLRTTHGRLSTAGIVPLAPGYDVVGWFARSPSVMLRVAEVLFGPPAARPRPRVLVADDLFARVPDAVRQALRPAVEKVRAAFGATAGIDISGGELADWRWVFRTVQPSEAWAVHGDWVKAHEPEFGPGIRERFREAEHLDGAEVERAKAKRGRIRARLLGLLGEDGIILAPSTPGIAPPVASPAAELDAFRAMALELLSPAGHAGLPQLSLPLATLDGCPLGLSLIGPPGADQLLIEMARILEEENAGCN